MANRDGNRFGDSAVRWAKRPPTRDRVSLSNSELSSICARSSNLLLYRDLVVATRGWLGSNCKLTVSLIDTPSNISVRRCRKAHGVVDFGRYAAAFAKRKGAAPSTCMQSSCVVGLSSGRDAARSSCRVEMSSS